MNNPYYQNVYQNRVNQFPTNNITWVQGIEGGKAFQLPPGSNAVLMDSENNGRFYIKSTDNVGMSTLRVFKYEEITDNVSNKPEVDLSEYVKKSELSSLISSMIGGRSNEQPISTVDGKSSRTIIE